MKVLFAFFLTPFRQSTIACLFIRAKQMPTAPHEQSGAFQAKFICGMIKWQMGLKEISY
jgi:hypothetical protein